MRLVCIQCSCSQPSPTCFQKKEDNGHSRHALQLRCPLHMLSYSVAQSGDCPKSHSQEMPTADLTSSLPGTSPGPPSVRSYGRLPGSVFSVHKHAHQPTCPYLFPKALLQTLYLVLAIVITPLPSQQNFLGKDSLQVTASFPLPATHGSVHRHSECVPTLLPETVLKATLSGYMSLLTSLTLATMFSQLNNPVVLATPFAFIFRTPVSPHFPSTCLVVPSLFPAQTCPLCAPRKWLALQLWRGLKQQSVARHQGCSIRGQLSLCKRRRRNPYTECQAQLDDF